jgi:hypothetical protein
MRKEGARFVNMMMEAWKQGNGRLANININPLKPKLV